MTKKIDYEKLESMTSPEFVGTIKRELSRYKKVPISNVRVDQVKISDNENLTLVYVKIAFDCIKFTHADYLDESTIDRMFIRDIRVLYQMNKDYIDDAIKHEGMRDKK